jgi:uncharacterized protein
MITENIKVIFDTNVWISFLIGKKLSNINSYLKNSSITVIITDELLGEIVDVTNREKLRKYFNERDVAELINLLTTAAKNITITFTHFINRDPKDNFLLDLIDASQADYLITGDKDLLELNPFKTAKIITPADFEKEITG